MKQDPKTPDGPFRLADRVEYQDGAIVSRTVMKSGKNSVTVFAFDAGESLEPHAAPFHALIHILDGKADVELSGKTHRLTAGESLYMPPKAPHAVEAHERFKMALTLLA